MKKLTWRLLFVFLLIIVSITSFYMGARATNTQVLEDKPVVYSGLDSLFTFEILGERYDILLEKERVLFQVFETSGKNDFIAFTLTKSDYPKLFEQGIAKSSFHTVTVISENTKPMIEVANNQPDHGGFTPTYTIIVDPTNGKVNVKE